MTFQSGDVVRINQRGLEGCVFVVVSGEVGPEGEMFVKPACAWLHSDWSWIYENTNGRLTTDIRDVIVIWRA